MDNAGSKGNQPPSLKPYANLLKFSFFNATSWMIALGTPLVLLAGQLGASSFEVGIIYAFVFLLLPVQILATSTLPRFGYKRQIIFAWITRGFFLFIPLILAYLSPESPKRWMVYALVFSALGFSFFRTIGSCAIMPLLYATLPENIRGRYFSTDQAVTGISGILTLLTCALLFQFLPVYEAFFWQYACALFGVVMTVVYISRFKDPPKPKATSLGQILEETPLLCLKPSPFRQYLVFMLTSALMGTAFVPLQAYYLKVEGGISVGKILVFTAIQYCGAILGTMVMRNRIDHTGVKPIFKLSLVLGSCVSAYWLLLVSGMIPGLYHALPVVYFLFGLSASQWNTAHLKYLPRICVEERQALHVSVHSSVVGIIGGVAPIFWGFLVKVPGFQPGVRTDMFSLFFIALLASQLVLFLYVPHLTSKHRERPSLQSGASLLRPFRYIGNLVNVIPVEKRVSNKEDT